VNVRDAPKDAAFRAVRWGRVVVSLKTTQLRVSWLREELRALPAQVAAEALEITCAAAESADLRAEAMVHALVELLADPEMEEAREVLRIEARAKQYLTLERLLRRPFAIKRGAVPLAALVPTLDDEVALSTDGEEPRARDLPDYGRGRPLTLGERKSLARRPPPELLHKVLADPHPDVIRNLLAAARLTEDDVVRLSTRRPGKAEVLAEVARHPRWCQRPRVRFALVMNPATPTEMAISMIALLRRNELSQVIEASALHPAIRAAARERFLRRPPMPPSSDGGNDVQ
jgi:hypothetical protein